MRVTAFVSFGHLVLPGNQARPELEQKNSFRALVFLVATYFVKNSSEFCFPFGFELKDQLPISGLLSIKNIKYLEVFMSVPLYGILTTI